VNDLIIFSLILPSQNLKTIENMKKLSYLFIIMMVMMSTLLQAQTKTTTTQAATQKKFVIHTDYGDMKGVLYNETPKHRDNFVKLVKSGFYDGTLFHRVILGFMIQGGDPDSKTAKPGQMLGSGGPGYTVPAEFNSKFNHKRGALAAARLGDGQNPEKASSGSQFYIVEPEAGAHFLDKQYTVFGEITSGFDVITKIASVPKDKSDRPTKDVKMTIKMVE
jgi:cyclophilin family peptidyl-prolyl cis-trans isomerase